MTICPSNPISSDQAGIYIHIPFCNSKCRYCDFYSQAGVSAEKRQAYGKAVSNILPSALDKFRYPVSSLYIGGGSPGVMAPEWFDSVRDILISRDIFPEDIEWTVEINPADVTKEFLLYLRQTGVNRLSFGIQSTESLVLETMGRRSRYEHLAELLPFARSAFSNISYDFIYGIGENKREITRELDTTFSLALPDHVSLYAYMKPESSAAPRLSGDDETAVEEAAARDFLLSCGFERYEVSNFARNNARSSHNLLYWTWKPYLGIGAGAHSFFPDILKREWYEDDWRAFIDFSACSSEELSPPAAMKEYIMMALRTVDGFPVDQFENIFDVPWNAVFSGITEDLISDNFLKKDDTRVRPTERGLQFLNYLTTQLFNRIEKYYDR